VTLLYGGKVIEEGRTADVLAHPRHVYTQALIAAGPRYDRPDAGLTPVPPAVFEQLRREIGAAEEGR
jgi:peptide/nickel transport system ATP-binding protein